MQPDGLDAGQRTALRCLRRAQLAEARRIRQAVADGYGVPVARLCALGRTREVSEARQVAMHAMRARLRWPLAVRNAPVPFEQIGALLGERDHSTIMHGVAAIAARLRGGAEADECLRYMARAIHAALDATYEGDIARRAAYSRHQAGPPMLVAPPPEPGDSHGTTHTVDLGAGGGPALDAR